MTKKRWINAHQTGQKKYWYCIGKCGVPVTVEDIPCTVVCKICGTESNVLQIQELRVLIEVK